MSLQGRKIWLMLVEVQQPTLCIVVGITKQQKQFHTYLVSLLLYTCLRLPKCACEMYSVDQQLFTCNTFVKYR